MLSTIPPASPELAMAGRLLPMFVVHCFDSWGRCSMLDTGYSVKNRNSINLIKMEVHYAAKIFDSKY